MKTNILYIFIISTLFFSCKKQEAKIELDKLTEFDINYSVDLTIPSTSITVNSPTTSVEFVTPNIPTQQSSKFSAEKTVKNLVDEIKMTKYQISVTGAGANLDFLKSLTIYVKSGNIADQIVATKTVFPTGITSATLDLTDVNIKNFIFEENIQFRVSATFDVSATLPNQTLKMDETVHVKATLLK